MSPQDKRIAAAMVIVIAAVILIVLWVRRESIPAYKVHVGDSPETVITALGSPDYDSRKHGDGEERFFLGYYGRLGETVAVVFVKGKVDHVYRTRK